MKDSAHAAAADTLEHGAAAVPIHVDSAAPAFSAVHGCALPGLHEHTVVQETFGRLS